MSTIKPRDLVRTPGGATGTVTEILPNGEREVRLLKGGLATFRASQLYLVRAAPPLPWPDLQAFIKSEAA